MYLINRIPRNLFNTSCCRRCTRVTVKYYSALKKPYSDEENKASFFNKYDEKLLFNTVIELEKSKVGCNAPIGRQKRIENINKQLLTTLRTVQPLPITMKYFVEESKFDTSPQETEESKQKSTDSESDRQTNFPYNSQNVAIDDASLAVSNLSAPRLTTIKEEIAEKKKILDEDKNNWMTHYENYRHDLVPHKEIPLERYDINYGTPDPKCPVSREPCGGCGALLHCQDKGIPGYIPSEIFKNAFKPGGASLSSFLCQRCHFLKEYNIALQMRVSEEDYLKVLQTISFRSSLIVLMVDLTDFPCSIWPGLADILGYKASLVVVGNKVDLLPKDGPKYLHNIKQVLMDNMKLNGFNNFNIKHIELISSKTGFGIENLISALHKVWNRTGDVYLVGCTNVGKSSLFNILLQSDFCKVQAADLVQRATTSPWPGTTLNLLKFPVTRFSGHRLYLRNKRLAQLRQFESKQKECQREALKQKNSAKNATVFGHVVRSEFGLEHFSDQPDNFSVVGRHKALGRTILGLDERHPDFVSGKWCYDTPGVIHPDQITHLLTTEELILTLPKELITPETFVLKPGNSLFIAGLARLDYVNGPNFIRATVFRSKFLPITICKSAEADSVYNELLGSELFAVPILRGDRTEKWPGLQLAKTFRITGKNPKESTSDVVLSNAGWIAINCGASVYEFEAWTPEKRGVHVRDCILPMAVTLRGARLRKSVKYKKHKFIV